MKTKAWVGTVVLIVAVGALYLLKQRAESTDDSAGSYLVLDLATGTAETLPRAPEGGWSAQDRVGRLVLRQVEPGTFVMGAAGDPESMIADESPAHRVTLTRGYALGVFEVTRGQWRHVMGQPDESAGGLAQDADGMPVENMTREMAARFLAALDKRFPAYAFALPTEAEWEYACKAGEASPVADAWERATAEGHAHPVGLRRPNAWGLYDMCGNVWEWCADMQHVYGAEAVVDPVHAAPPGKSPPFAARGGGWRNRTPQCQPTYRAFFAEDIDIIPIGLRVLCRPKTAAPQSHGGTQTVAPR